jgi:hypothetical protein
LELVLKKVTEFGGYLQIKIGLWQLAIFWLQPTKRVAGSIGHGLLVDPSTELQGRQWTMNLLRTPINEL